MTTSVDILNHALELIGAQTQIASLTDGTVAANAALVLYAPTVQMLLRQLDPDFARRRMALVAIAPPDVPTPPWAFDYTYPADCLRLRQIAPPSGGYDIFDPQPIRGNVAFSYPLGVPTKVILTNEANAAGIYTTSLVTEGQWDSLFEEAVARQLANPLSMALAGRPDFARELLDEAARYEQMAELADESMARSG